MHEAVPLIKTFGGLMLSIFDLTFFDLSSIHVVALLIEKLPFLLNGGDRESKHI